MVLVPRRGRPHRPTWRNRLHTSVALVALCAGALALSGCGGGRGSEGQIIVNGSTTILPIAEQAAKGFEDANPGVAVLVSGMGSSAGIEAVSAGTADIGTASRDLKPEEQDKGLIDTPIAFDGIAVIVNPSNPVNGLTLTQLRDIFSGKTTNWREVGGEDREIDLVNRDEASGTREAFNKIVMGDEARFDRSAVVLPGTGQVRDVVARSEGAIGYISVGFVAPRFTDTAVKALKVDGVEPGEATVASKEYPIARALHFFTKGEPTGQSRDFIEFVLSEEFQNDVVVDAGFVPVSEGANR